MQIPFWKKLSLPGIVVGAVVDVVGTNIWGLALVTVLIVFHHLIGHPQAEMLSQIHHWLSDDPWVIFLNYVIGGAFTLLGGYVAAVIAKHNEVLNGGSASFLCIVFVLCTAGSLPLWQILLAIVFNPLVGMLGGYLRLRQTREVL